mgnify:CR=1 FL=1
MNESDLIKKILNGISPVKCTGDVYIEDSQGVRKSAVNLGYDGKGDVIINFNGRFK